MSLHHVRFDVWFCYELKSHFCQHQGCETDQKWLKLIKTWFISFAPLINVDSQANNLSKGFQKNFSTIKMLKQNDGTKNKKIPSKYLREINKKSVFIMMKIACMHVTLNEMTANAEWDRIEKGTRIFHFISEKKHF